MSGQGHDSHGHDGGDHGHDDHGTPKSLDDFLKDVHPEKIRDISGKHEEAHNFAYQGVMDQIGKFDFDKADEDKVLDLLTEYFIHYEHKKGIVHKDHLDSANRSDEFKAHYRQRTKDMINKVYEKEGGIDGVVDEAKRNKGFASILGNLHNNIKKERISKHMVNSYEKHLKKISAEDHIKVAKKLKELNSDYKNIEDGELVQSLGSYAIQHANKEYQTYKVQSSDNDHGHDAGHGHH